MSNAIALLYADSIDLTESMISDGGWRRMNLSYVAFALLSEDEKDTWSMVEDGYASKNLRLS